MNKRIIESTMIFCIIFISITITTIPAITKGLHTIRGDVYINGDLASESLIQNVKIKFPTGNETDNTSITGHYQIDFFGHDWEIGVFYVYHDGLWFQPIKNKTIEITPDQIGYKIDLYIITQLPPDKPINPQPENNSKDVSLNPTLSVYVTDPDNDIMDVFFYNAFDDTIIDTDLNVNSGDTASIQWNDLTYNTTYQWYAVAKDSEYESKSDIWTFTTKKFDNIAPKVSITRPERGLYIFDNKILPRFIRPSLIIGKITIIVNATDKDTGIEKVEFYINGKLKGTDSSEPFSYVWKRDRIRLFHIFVIKVIAYDEDGVTDSDKMIVRKFL